MLVLVLSIVYNEFISKAIHPHFGTVFGKWKKKFIYQSTAKQYFQTKLKTTAGTWTKKAASSNKGKSKKITPHQMEWCDGTTNQHYSRSMETVKTCQRGRGWTKDRDWLRKELNEEGDNEGFEFVPCHILTLALAHLVVWINAKLFYLVP